MLDGAKIRRLRKGLNMSQKELGEKVGLSETMIQWIETEVRNTETDKVPLFAKALEVEVGELFKA